MSNFAIRPELLPTHGDLLTAHWPADQQNQFTAAVHGIRGTPWFQTGCAQLSDADRERVAMSFAFAAFAAIRRRPGRELGTDAELMMDNPGIGR